MGTCCIGVGVAMPAGTPVGHVLLLLGAFAPSLAALWLTARIEGGAAVETLLRRVIQWRVAGRWYLFAAGYVAAIKLSVALIYTVATRQWPPFCQESVGLI